MSSLAARRGRAAHLLILTGAFLLLVATLMFARDTRAEAADDDGKIWICHVTSSLTNPYNLSKIDFDSWGSSDPSGHGATRDLCRERLLVPVPRQLEQDHGERDRCLAQDLTEGSQTGKL